MLEAVCTHVTLSAASRDSAVKLTTDSYQFWVAHLSLQVTFQSHILFARKVQKYGDAFLKTSSIVRSGLIQVDIVPVIFCRFISVNSLHASGNFSNLLITFANNLDPYQDCQTVSPDQDPNTLSLNEILESQF